MHTPRLPRPALPCEDSPTPEHLAAVRARAAKTVLAYVLTYPYRYRLALGAQEDA